MDISTASGEDNFPDLDLGQTTRHLGPDPVRSKRFPRSWQYVAKGASRLDFGRHTVICRDLPDYKLPLLEHLHPQDLRPRVDRRRQLHRLRGRWGSDAAEGRDLARSDVPLPSDQRPRRCPSLERQEAFRYETTAKRHQHHQRTNADGEDAATVAELYRLGLLYDDEHLRGSGFDFGALAHEEPAYSLRPAKRARKLNKSRGYEPEQHDNGAAGGYLFRFGSQTLPLELSFAELARDDAIAQFLISPSPSETSDDDEDATMHDFYGRNSVDSQAIQHRLDELKGLARSLPSPSEEEEDDEAAAAAAVPDLVFDESNPSTQNSDSHDDYDTDNTITTKDKGESEEDLEWMVLSRNDDAGEVADDDDDDDDGAERDAASGFGGGEEGPAAGAWVVLGDDS